MHRSRQSSVLLVSLAFSLVPAIAFAQTPPPDASATPPPTEPPISTAPNAIPSTPPPIVDTPPVAPPPPTNPPVMPQPILMDVNVVPPAIPVRVVHKPKEKFPTRSIRIAPSLQVLLYEPFPYEKISRIGTGLFGAYEFFLSRSFVIGINLSYRYYPGQANMQQVGYGLMLKHYLAGMKSLDSIFMPYVEYGLLLQINTVSTRKGSGTAHDTRLSAGTDFRIAKKIFFVEASYHYSRLGLFEQPAEPLHNVEFDLGWRYPW